MNILLATDFNFILMCHNYANIILIFLLELYIFFFLFTFKLNRQNHFYIRAAIGIVCVGVVSFGAAVFYEFFGSNIWGRTITYFFLFAISIVQVKTCFKESIFTVLFCCSMAYAAQNLAYKIFLTIWCAGIQVGIFPFQGAFGELFYKLFYYAFFAFEIFAIYHIFIKRTYKYLPHNQRNYGVLINSFIIIGITIVLCSVEDVYFGQLSPLLENKYDNIIYFYLRQTGNLFSVVCCVCVLLILSASMEKRKLKQEIQYLQHTMSQREEQFAISKDTIELINIKCHDMRHKVKAMLTKNNEVSSNMMQELNDAISIYDANILTGNKMLDIILTEKSLYCEKNGIQFSCMVDGEKLSFISDVDLYCLFGNVIDNAIEAVRGLPLAEQRVVNIVVKPKDSLLVIQTENYLNGDLQFEDGLPVTTKSNKLYHGFGMKSIRMIVHKYGGEVTVFTTGDIFHLNILFPLL